MNYIGSMKDNMKLLGEGIGYLSNHLHKLALNLPENNIYDKEI